MTAANGARAIRVLQLRSLSGAGGGPEKTILEYAAGGGPPGFDVSVCYLRNPGDPDYAMPERAAAMGVRYHEICERGAIDWRAWRALHDLVRDLAPDVLHCHDYKVNLMGYWLSRRLPLALLSSSHGWGETGWRGSVVYYPGDRVLLARFPRVVAVSDEIRAALLRAGARAENVVVVRNAVDTEHLVRDPGRQADIRRANGLPVDAIVLGFVGRLEPEKRVDLLIEAAARLRAHEPRIMVLIAGDGPKRAEWTELAQRLGVIDRCRFLGRRDDIAALHHAMDVYIQPSRREGTSNALLEAMALQTPIVATAAGGNGELIDDGVHGLLVPPEDGHALEAAIARVLADPESAAARARAARRRAETDFSVAHWKGQLSDVYRDLLARVGWPGAAASAIHADPARVSYIIPARNEAAYIARAVESILAQQPAAPSEVIVVDNGSTDGTGEIARAAGARVLASPATTAAGARNDGARAAAGDVLCFIDGDCVVAPDHLATVLAALAGGASAVGAACLPPENGTVIQRAWAPPRAGIPMRDVWWLPSANCAVCRSVFEQMNGFDARLTTCEDSDLGYRLRAAGHRLCADPRIVVIHHREPATFGAFLRKELWRGRDSFRSFRGHGYPVRELPSLLYPALVVGAPLTGCVLFAAGRTHIGISVAVLGLLLPLLSAVLTARRGAGPVWVLALLYWGWGVARFGALTGELFRLLLAPERGETS